MEFDAIEKDLVALRRDIHQNPELGWDGSVEGVKASPGFYVYWAELVYCDWQKEIVKCLVQLIR